MFRLILAIAALNVTALAAGGNRLTPEERAGGWKLLFDGRSFKHWKDPARMSPPGDAWTIEDGCLRARARPALTEDLFTRDRYRDFELRFQWRISPGGNSGVKYRIQNRVFLLEDAKARFEDLVSRSLQQPPRRLAKGQDYVIGFEYQLIDNAAHPDARNGPTHTAGALYDMVSPSRDAARPAGEFNDSRLIVKGSHVEHWLNGVKVVDADLSATDIAARVARRWGADSPVGKLLIGQPRRSGPISLQNHGDDTWFRDLRILRLK